MKQSLMHGSQQTARNKHYTKQKFVSQYLDHDDAKRKSVWLADWRKHKLPYCSLYVVSTDSKWPCKIGISVSPPKRISSIQTSVWRPVEVQKCYWLRTVAEAKMLEKKIHSTLSESGKWLHGEWFDLRPEETDEIIQFEAMILGIECNDEIEPGPVLEEISIEYERRVRSPSAILERGNHFEKISEAEFWLRPLA